MPNEPSPACPICGRPSQPATRPFCSPRCRAVDLGRWLGETYAVPGEPERPDDPEAE
ncbi:DNA gyrase inhibitor YacG [Roseomonas populi]|uniref:DNA gyrase inhibitor YacG n=1 Tax=Roseomonas populi TaxID=3121582 RepID=A0ABT1X185_9PROT|nr:DNA gyrase inhibitor YacG [Roseomonas pecuniae]MCR0981845.1 DNA gyrase inhibitor YacG [Roseomonas pecuniae]